ncbi:MAG TPA: hypothetical protein VHC67_13420 [Gaiellaceae bacterium]|jgi:hypothetical protein|nr:hypothetical protein [Gaiellaceae bacterium]
MYASLTRLTSLLLIALGVAMIVETVWHGGGAGIVLGVLFVLAGGGRLLLLRRRTVR